MGRRQHHVVPIALPGWRHEDGARHAGRIHFFQKAFGRERCGLVRTRRLARRPGTLRRVRGPDMHLGIDDHHGRSLVLKGAGGGGRPDRWKGGERSVQLHSGALDERAPEIGLLLELRG